MRERLQRASTALATPCVGAWPQAVPWVSLGLLAVAFALSLLVGFSAGQLLAGIGVAGFVGFQVAGALWSLLAASRRQGGETLATDPTACPGIASAVRPAFLATLQGAVAWLPLLLAPWFLGSVTFGMALRLLLVGAIYALSARLVAAVVTAGVEAPGPPVLRLPGALLVTLVLFGGVVVWPPERLAGLALLSPSGPIEALLLPVAQLLRALRHDSGLPSRVPVCAPLLPYLASHAALWLTCVLLIAVLRRWRPGPVRATRRPHAALVVLVLAMPGAGVPAGAREGVSGVGPVLLWYSVRFEADGSAASGAVSVLPLTPANAVLLLAERETRGRLVASWRTEGHPESERPRLEVSRSLRLPARQPVVIPVECPESCQVFRAGVPAVFALYDDQEQRNGLLAVELGSASAVRELSERQSHLVAPVILTLPFSELRPLLRTAPPPAILARLSELAALPADDATLLLDALCVSQAGMRIVVLDDLSGPLPAMAADARRLLPACLGERKVETGADYLSAQTARPLAEMTSLSVRPSAEDATGPLSPVPVRGRRLGAGLCSYVAFDPGMLPPNAAVEGERLLQHLLHGGGGFSVWRWAPPGACLPPPTVLQAGLDSAPFAPPWRESWLRRAARQCPAVGAVAALFLAAGLAPWVWRRRAAAGAGPGPAVTAPLRVPLAVAFCLAAGRWLGALGSPWLTELAISCELPALERTVTTRAVRAYSPWASSLPPGGWTEAPPPRLRNATFGSLWPGLLLRQDDGSHLEAGVAAAGQVTEVNPSTSHFAGKLRRGADGRLAGTLANRGAGDLAAGLIGIQEPVQGLHASLAFFIDPPLRFAFLPVPPLRAGDTLEIPPSAPVSDLELRKRLAGTPLAALCAHPFLPWLGDNTAFLVGALAPAGSAAGRRRGGFRRGDLQVTMARLDVDCSAVPALPTVAPTHAAGMPGSMTGSWWLPPYRTASLPEPGESTTWQPLSVRRTWASASGRYGLWTWTEIPADAELVLRIRNAWLLDSGGSAAEPTPPATTLGTLEIAVLDVNEGVWKSALRDGLPPEAVPPSAVADPAETDDSAVPYAVVNSADGRRRVAVAEGYAHVLSGTTSGLLSEVPHSTAALLDAVDACASVVRLPEARRFVQRPEGVVLVRAQRTAAPCQASLLSVDASIETPGTPAAEPSDRPR